MECPAGSRRRIAALSYYRICTGRRHVRSRCGRRRYGFTLLELIVVLVVLAVLVAIAIPTYQSIIGGAQESVAKTQLREIDRGAHNYAALREGPGTAVTIDDYSHALSETNVVASGPGAYAAAGFTLNDSADGFSQDKTTIHIAIVANTVGLAWAGLFDKCVYLRSTVHTTTTQVWVGGQPGASCNGSIAIAGEDAFNTEPTTPTTATTSPSGPPTTEAGGATTTTTLPVHVDGPDDWFQTNVALLVGDDLDVSGNVTVTGDAVVVGGDLTASGSVHFTTTVVGKTATCSGPCGSQQASAQQLGALTTHVGDVPVTEVTANQLWHQYAPSAIKGRLNYAGGWEPGNWFDLCPDGTVRLPDGAGPCIGSIVINMNNNNPGWLGFEGWRWEESTDRWISGFGGSQGPSTYGPAPLWQNPARVRAPATWYVMGATARLEGANGGPLTVIAEASSDARSGSVDIAGSGANYTGVLGHIGFFADRDLALSGSFSTGAGYTGWSYAREAVRAGGNATYRGVLVAGGKSNTAGSLIDIRSSSLSGSFTLVYEAVQVAP